MSIAEQLTTIAQNQQKVYEAGYTAGQSAGGGTEGAYNEGYEAGRQAEWDVLWDGIQQNGNRVNYEEAFANFAWNNENFKPKYPMQPTYAKKMFLQNRYSGDLTQVATLDFSKATNVQFLFGYSHLLTRVGVIDTTSAADLTGLFHTCKQLVTIDKLILKNDGSQGFTQTFNIANKLTNLTIEGVIGKNGFDVSWSTNLAHDSLMSIITALKSSVTSNTITLGIDNLAKLTNEEKAIATQKGWTLA